MMPASFRLDEDDIRVVAQTVEDDCRAVRRDVESADIAMIGEVRNRASHLRGEIHDPEVARLSAGRVHQTSIG